ncbi:uncharacterized protein LOC126369549 [Pectinophora gossypiella]|uniref:uncharacterized protein LOC126369549 n=1 Tax=Pectinophora gossypiella TaxID=13191 RepID=UPI00214E2F8A|nr:uncharacterized protein LOC126369549 [Pectinophora gossypiella]
MARKEILLVLLFTCTLVCEYPVSCLDYIVDEIKSLQDILFSGKSDVTKDDDKQTENSTSTSNTNWDCSNSTLNVRRCVLVGNVTKPETLKVYKDETSDMKIPSKPPKGVLGDFSPIKENCSLDEVIAKIEKKYKAVFDFIKNALSF